MKTNNQIITLPTKTPLNKAKEIIITIATLFIMFTFNVDLFMLGQKLQDNPHGGLAYKLAETMLIQNAHFMDVISFKLGYFL